MLAPDENASDHARGAAKALGVPWDYLVKERIDAFHVRVEPKSLPVRDRTVVIVDDIISTGTTMATAATELKRQGARGAYLRCACMDSSSRRPCRSSVRATTWR